MKTVPGSVIPRPTTKTRGYRTTTYIHCSSMISHTMEGVSEYVKQYSLENLTIRKLLLLFTSSTCLNLQSEYSYAACIVGCQFKVLIH